MAPEQLREANRWIYMRYSLFVRVPSRTVRHLLLATANLPKVIVRFMQFLEVWSEQRYLSISELLRRSGYSAELRSLAKLHSARGR
jgi:hypothetical protein